MRMREAGAVLRHRAFRYQFAGFAISVTGSMVAPVALTLGLLQVTGDAAVAGIALTASTVPLAVLLLFGGVLADRMRRDRVMVAADALRGLTQLGVGAMMLSGEINLAVLIVLQVVYGTAQAFHLPAASGLTSSTVPKADLQQANALLSGVRSLSGVLGPLIAGTLTATVGGGWGVVFDGVSFLLSSWLVSRIRLDQPSRPGPGSGVLRDLADGFKVVRGTPWIWTSIVGFATTHVALAAFLVAGPLIVADGGAVDALGWAALIAAMSVGELVGDVIALRLKPARPLVAARCAELLFVPALLAVALGWPGLVQVAAVAVAGVGMALADTLWYTALQQRVPDESLSKVSSYDWFGSVVLRPAGYAVGAAFAGAGILIAGAVLVLLTRILSLSFTSVRAMSALPPEPVEQAELENA
ncbi:COG0477: Permeases of the major facilitator superfamily [Alloactinosynnema sp. L-07]|uniref:MFS transporter n=1 Tax=Alloactinosynnema sp. L-07 TaxID=1653480 RepID=UPI00065EF5AC|nr:MFS transporter [Alloactinosynnema sp. L-07]CRK61882.1 COG0477: Permeases of the major facilitator superfamily [Alloactinosynnema sp. L-07]